MEALPSQCWRGFLVPHLGENTVNLGEAREAPSQSRSADSPSRSEFLRLSRTNTECDHSMLSLSGCRARLAPSSSPGSFEPFDSADTRACAHQSLVRLA
jgi:hypothetical protein